MFKAFKSINFSPLADGHAVSGSGAIWRGASGVPSAPEAEIFKRRGRGVRVPEPKGIRND